MYGETKVSSKLKCSLQHDGHREWMGEGPDWSWSGQLSTIRTLTTDWHKMKVNQTNKPLIFGKKLRNQLFGISNIFKYSFYLIKNLILYMQKNVYKMR